MRAMFAPARDRRDHARARLGHLLALLAHARRLLPDGLGRPHRLHRHRDLDGSAEPGLHDPAHQPRASLRQGRRGRAAPPGQRGRRHALRVPRASRRSPPPATPRADADAPAADGARPARGAHADRARPAGRGRLRAARRPLGRPRHQPDRRRRARGAAASTCWPPRPGCGSRAIFSPEHGIDRAGRRQRARTAATRPPGCRSGASTARRAARRPRCCNGIDTLVFDIQDVGVRYYTYLTTLVYVLEEGGRRGIHVVVLDRPNPITGRVVEGPLMDPDLRSFTAPHPIPVRTGMTIGEFAQMVVGGAEAAGQAHRGPARGLAARAVVRRDRAAVGESVAQHPDPDPGAALLGRSGSWRRPTSRSGAAPTCRSR